MGIGRTREESWTKAAPCAGHVSMRRAHVIMLRPPMYHGTKVIATTDGAPLSPTILNPRRVLLADFNLASSFPRVSMNFFDEFRDEFNRGGEIVFR